MLEIQSAKRDGSGTSRVLMGATNGLCSKLPPFASNRSTYRGEKERERERERENFNFSSLYVCRPFDVPSKRVRQPARIRTFVTSFPSNPRRHSTEITSWKAFPRLLHRSSLRTLFLTFSVNLKSLSSNNSGKERRKLRFLFCDYRSTL